jgi:hypothetical protein
MSEADLFIRLSLLLVVRQKQKECGILVVTFHHDLVMI